MQIPYWAIRYRNDFRATPKAFMHQKAAAEYVRGFYDEEMVFVQPSRPFSKLNRYEQCEVEERLGLRTRT
ncbi:MAG: hypothetical protein KIT83_07425 [Bryobacterales bacterium]|nr:hypothetical protein [Bryobacterales bacterium]